MPRLRLVKSYHQISVDLKEDCNVILGRSSDCDVICNQNSGISRQHCCIQYDQELQVFLLSDLESSNGTYLNGLLVDERVQLEYGDELSLGELIHFLFEENSESLPLEDPGIELARLAETRRLDRFDLEPDEKIAHFRIIRQLGAGAMSTVYLATDEILMRNVTLKFMQSQNGLISGDEKRREQFRKRFVREAQSAALINHMNIAQIYEANFTEGLWYIAMEYIEGTSLADKLRKEGIFSLEDLVNTGNQIINALEHVWNRHNVIHRDIKPHNLMLNRFNEIKIVDFGLAKIVTNESCEPDGDETTAGIPIGTPHYMSPEQSVGKTILTSKVDIFALGVTLYELATGEKPFDDPSEASIYRSKLTKDYVPLSQLRPEFPQNFETLIDSMLLPIEHERISNYAEIRGQLSELN